MISSLRSLVLVSLFILILPRIIGVNGIWLTIPLSEAVTVFLAACLYRAYGKSYLHEASV